MNKEAFHYTIKVVTITMIMGLIFILLLKSFGIVPLLILFTLGIMSFVLVLIYLNELKILETLTRLEIDKLKQNNPCPPLE